MVEVFLCIDSLEHIGISGSTWAVKPKSFNRAMTCNTSMVSQLDSTRSILSQSSRSKLILYAGKTLNSWCNRKSACFWFSTFVLYTSTIIVNNSVYFYKIPVPKYSPVGVALLWQVVIYHPIDTEFIRPHPKIGVPKGNFQGHGHFSPVRQCGT